MIITYHYLYMGVILFVCCVDLQHRCILYSHIPTDYFLYVCSCCVAGGRPGARVFRFLFRKILQKKVRKTEQICVRIDLYIPAFARVILCIPSVPCVLRTAAPLRPRSCVPPGARKGHSSNIVVTRCIPLFKKKTQKKMQKKTTDYLHINIYIYI